VKEVFRQLRLDGHSGEYEDKAYDRINVLIDKVPEVTSPRGGLSSVALSSTPWRRCTSSRSKSFGPILTNIRGRCRYPLAPFKLCLPLFPPHPPCKRWHVFYEKIHIFTDPPLLCRVTVPNRTVSALLFERFSTVSFSVLSPIAHRQSPGFIRPGSLACGRRAVKVKSFGRVTQLRPHTCGTWCSSNIAGSIPRSALPQPWRKLSLIHLPPPPSRYTKHWQIGPSSKEGRLGLPSPRER